MVIEDSSGCCGDLQEQINEINVKITELEQQLSYEAVVVLSNAQLRAGTRVIVIPGNAGEIIAIDDYYIESNYGGNNVWTGGAQITFAYEGNHTISVTAGLSNVTFWQVAGNCYLLNDNPQVNTIPYNTGQIVGRWVEIGSSAVLLGGNASNDNTVTVRIIYSVIKVPMV